MYMQLCACMYMCVMSVHAGVCAYMVCVVVCVCMCVVCAFMCVWHVCVCRCVRTCVCVFVLQVECQASAPQYAVTQPW